MTADGWAPLYIYICMYLFEFMSTQTVGNHKFANALTEPAMNIAVNQIDI